MLLIHHRLLAFHGLISGTLLALASAAPMPVQLLTEETRITLGADTPPNDGFGRAFAIDGDRLVASEPNSGQVFVYKRKDSVWTLEDTLPAVDLDQGFGGAVAIDGDVIAVGNTRADGDGVGFAGAAYIFERQANSQWEFVQKLASDQPRNPNSMGSSLALEGDTLLIGESGADIRNAQDKITAQDVGCVHVFRRSTNGNWQWIEKHFPKDLSTFQYVGSSLVLDGDTYITGGPQKKVGATDAAGSAYVFVQTPSGSWTEQAALTASDVTKQDFFGDSVALSGDTAVIGKSGLPKNPHGIYVFQRTNTNWRQVVKLTSGTTGDVLKPGVAINGAADVIVAGGSRNTAGGKPFGGTIEVFTKDANGSWNSKKRLTARAPLENAYMGTDIAMSADTIVTGAPNIFSQGVKIPGAVHVFSIDYVSADEDVADYLRSLFYYPTDNAPFRYKVLLYEDSNGLRPAPEKIDHFFTDTDRERAQNLLEQVREALRLHPQSPAYRDLYLDAYYDLTVADAIAARRSLVDIDKLRLDAPSRAGGYVIDDEIAAYEDVLVNLADTIAKHLDILSDTVGLESEPPLGFQIFKERVPSRTLESAQYLENETLKPVLQESDAPIVNGYRDFILLLDLIGDYGSNAATLAHLYGLADRHDEAQAEITNAMQFVYLQGNTVRGIFKEENGPDPEPAAEALARWNQSLADLDRVDRALESSLNPLGFERDFLVLLNKPQGATGEYFDTFNILRERLDDLTSNSNPIVRALQQRDEALDAYDRYRGNVDQLEDRLVDLTAGSKARLLAIVGAPHGSSAYNEVPRANDPDNGGYIVGSELWDQFKDIERARVQIDINSTEIRNLQEKVRIEAERNLFEIETKNAIAELQIEYGELKAEVEEEIGKVNAVQAGSSAVKDTLSAKNPGEAMINAGNGIIQVTGELVKGELNAQKEKLAAWEQAEIIGKENQILNANSKAQIETWMLDMNTLALNSQENALIITQEMGRLVALLREKADLERRIDLSKTALKSRYFADPVHMQRYNQELVIANQKFRDAQEVVFFLARALEYKWNEPFETIMLGKEVQMETIYKVRNASELQSLVDAMELADFQKDGEGAQKESFLDVFSMREDAFGLGSGVDAIEAFRAQLRTLATGDPKTDDYVEIAIPFSTVRDPLASLDGRNFFRGPRFRSTENSQEVINAGRYLDKIESLQVTIPGSHTTGAQAVPTTLTYSGTSFIRKKAVGHFPPNQPNRLEDEMEAFPTRVSNFENGVWNAGHSLSASPTALLSSDAPPANLHVVDVFRERSVACSDWKLRIVIKDGVPLLNLDEIDDVRIYFKHTAITRQDS